MITMHVARSCDCIHRHVVPCVSHSKSDQLVIDLINSGMSLQYPFEVVVDLVLDLEKQHHHRVQVQELEPVKDEVVVQCVVVRLVILLIDLVTLRNQTIRDPLDDV